LFLSLVTFLGLPRTSAFDSNDISPVGRIVELLKTLKGSSQADGKAEQQIYDKYACWCEKTSKGKADDIGTAQDDLRSLGQRILKLKGKVATRTSEIALLTENINSKEVEQGELTAVRQKQNAGWADDSAEMKQALAALQDAITVLAGATTGDNAQKHGAAGNAAPTKAPAMIQETQQMRSRYAVNAVLEKLPSMIGLAPAHMALLTEFTTAKEGYAPQSATIQGMLGDMYLTFSTNLESSTLGEADQNHDYEELTASMEKENNQFKATRARKETEKAEAEAMLADTTKAYEDTEKQMEADEDFFEQTKEACLSKHDDWKVRTDLRNQELKGIDAALDILTSDENRELFARSIKPGVESFLQIASSPALLQNSAFAPAARAYNAVKAQVKKTHSVRLAALAVQIRTAKAGHFDAVMGAIDKMLTTLETEGADDLAKKTQCLDEYQKIGQTVNDLDWDIKNNKAKIAKLEKLMELRTGEKEAASVKINETMQYIDDIEKERQAEHDLFIQAKIDDEQAIEVLDKAKEAFKAYMTNNNVKTGPIQGLRLLQEPVFDTGDDAPDATFSSKGNNKGASKNVLSLFSYIIEDLHDELSADSKAEEKSLMEHEKEKAAAEKLVSDLDEKVATLEGIIAKRIEDKKETNQDMAENNKDRDAELDYQAKIKPDCDWIIKAFDQRAEARTAEANGLTTAKEFLAGQTSLLETSKGNKFDDEKLPSLGFLGITH